MLDLAWGTGCLQYYHWEKGPFSRELQAVLMLPATSSVSWKQIYVRKVITELFNRFPHMSVTWGNQLGCAAYTLLRRERSWQDLGCAGKEGNDCISECLLTRNLWCPFQIFFFTDTNNEKEMDLILGLPKAFGLNDSSIAFSLSILQHLFANC